MFNIKEYMCDYHQRPEVKKREYQYRHRLDVIKRRKKAVKKYQDSHKKELSNYHKIYYQKNKNKCNERVRNYNQTEHGKQSHRTSSKKYQQTASGKQVHSVSQRNRKYLKRSNKDGITKKQWEDILRKYNHQCVYCGVNETTLNILGKYITMDHVIPLSKGGEHCANNIVPACAVCNSKKCVKLIT